MTQKQVPVHHFSHHLSAKQYLGFVRAWTRERYAKRSRPSIDPVVFTLQLVTFFEGIRSKRQLIETVSLNLAHRWYLGYTLDIDIFQRFFKQVVDLCQEVGLAWGRDDGTEEFPPWDLRPQFAATGGLLATRSDLVARFGSGTISVNGASVRRL